MCKKTAKGGNHFSSIEQEKLSQIKNKGRKDQFCFCATHQVIDWIKSNIC